MDYFIRFLLREGFDINIMILVRCFSQNSKGVLGKYLDEVNDDKIREVLNNISLFKTSLGDIRRIYTIISMEIFKIFLLNVYKNMRNISLKMALGF